MKKMIVVKQHDLTDCGPACLSSIIQYYGGYVPIEMIRLNAKTNQNGTSAYNLIKTASRFGLSTKSYKVDNINFLNKDLFPLVAHVKLKNNLNHFITIYGSSGKYFEIMDPAKGKIKISKKTFKEIFTNVIIVFHPRERIATYKKPESVISILKRYLYKHKRLVVKMIFLSIIITLINVFFSYYLKISINILDRFKGLTYITFFSITLFILLIIKCILEYLKNNVLFRFNYNVSDSLYNFFIHKLFILPLNFIKSKSTGEIITRFQELNEINEFIPSIIISGIIDLISISIALYFSFMISFKLSLILLVVVLIYIVFSLLLNNPTLEKINNNVEASCDFNEKIVDTTSAMISIKYTHNEENMEKRLSKSKEYYLNNYLKLEKYLNKNYLYKNLILELGIFIIYYYGIYFCFMNKITIMNLFVFTIMLSYIVSPIKELIDVMPRILFMKSSFYKLSEFSIISDSNNGIKKFINGNIEIKNLFYAYNDIDFIIKDLSLKIKKGEKVLIKGDSGSGKSTLCNILSGQIPYYKGNIYIGDEELRNIDKSDYYKNVTYIGQNDSLITDTIYSNINFERKVSDKEFSDICKICEIDKIVKKRYSNMATVINDQSSNISGGEKQRIILARGLINCGSIIILDEALSEVNIQMEKNIINRLFKYFHDRTIIYISHKEYDDIFKRVINL